MNYQKSIRSILICLILLLSSASFYAQREIIVKRSIIVSAANPEYFIERCDYKLLIPTNRLGKQEVLSYKYSIKPEKALKTETDEYYLKWKAISFGELKNVRLEVEMKIKTSIYDLKTAKKHPVINKQDLDTLSCLKDEENFRSNSKPILKAAEGLTGSNREEITKAIFNYVTGNLEYHIFLEQDRGAKKALREGRGDCTEYSELMVTLCRAKQIPARIVMGLIPRSNGEVGHHNWVEVFFPEYGWVAFDPTWADHMSSTTTFYSMSNSYVQLSYRRFVNSTYCSCSESSFPFSYKLKDSCAVLSNGINIKFRNMLTFYNSGQLDKATTLLDTLLLYEPDSYAYWTFKGMICARQNNFEKGYEALKNAIDFSETTLQKALSLYAMSNYFSLKDDKENTVKYLKEAIDMGFSNYYHLINDSDFKNVKDYPPFIELAEGLKNKKEQPSINKK
jgi:tetratricopeptide (TPR) repeat protein